jgi:predicted GNAT family acetyltransferase
MPQNVRHHLHWSAIMRIGCRWLHRFCLLLALLFLVPGPAVAVAPPGDLLGSVWQESENGWSGVWTRRGGSDTFDAVWTKDGGRVTAVLTMQRTGANTVSIYRRDTSDNLEVDYTASIGRDGYARGSGKVRSSGMVFDWTASIQGARMERPEQRPEQRPERFERPAGDLLGAVWQESENGWSGVWTRRGGSDTFDAVWTKDGGRVTAVLTMQRTGANTVSILRRDTSDSLEVDYTGSIGRDGSVRGSGKVRSSGMVFDWTASIQGTRIERPVADLLGSVWQESENGWSGVWTRRGGSDTFDAVWTKDGGRVTAVLTMQRTGANTVSIYRRDTSDSLEVDYTASIGRDGSVRGSGKVRSSGMVFDWTARVR